MKKEIQPSREQGMVRVLPPVGVELFLSSPDKESNLPIEIVRDPRLIEQAASRRNLHRLFDQCFDQATKEDLTQQPISAELWDKLSNFLEQDENNARILLYLPFEILPNISSQESSGRRFADLYHQGWVRLLFETEPRANFVDGDVLEPGLGQPERISKAGHLTPELLKREIVSTHDVLMLLKLVPEGEILKSLAEGVVVAGDRGLIHSADWDNVKEIIGKRIGSLSLLRKRGEDFKDPNSDKISPERARWLRKMEEEDRDDREADQLSEQIINGMSMDNAPKQGVPEKVIILAIIKAGKQLVKMNRVKTREFGYASEKIIQSMWKLNDASLKDTIIGGLNQWTRLGIVDHEFLQKLGIKLTDLSSLPYDNNELSDEFRDLTTAANKIKSHPVLSRVLYPGFLVFGSRLKGYADLNADLDAAMFFKPNVGFENREQILKILKKDFPEIPNIDKFLEYWTSEEDGKLIFGTIQENTRVFVGESAIHFFMGGAWIGGDWEVNKLRNNMLERYLDLSRFGDAKTQIRRKFLGQIELDVLQYRLMHKGYRKFYPQTDKESTQNSDLIDLGSDFWDPGFRRVATKLFLSRVFLPDLS